MPGIWMSRTSRANSSATSASSACFGGFGADQAVAGVIQDGFEHGQVLRLIVHEQDVDPFVARASDRGRARRAGAGSPCGSDRTGVFARLVL